MKDINPMKLEYALCPEPVKRRIETAFEWTLVQNPYPQSNGGTDQLDTYHGESADNGGGRFGYVVPVGKQIAALIISFPAGNLTAGSF